MHAVKPELPAPEIEESQPIAPQSHIHKAMALLKKEFEAIAKLLEVYEYADDDRFTSVHEYAFALKAKQAQMSNQRVARKTVEYFKLKLKPTDESN